MILRRVTLLIDIYGTEKLPGANSAYSLWRWFQQFLKVPTFNYLSTCNEGYSSEVRHKPYARTVMPNCMSTLEFHNIAYTGGSIDDSDTFDILPDYLQQFYRKYNGLICFDGTLHIRGCVKNPLFHSLNEFWFGKHSLAKLFSSINQDDIPFAQDFLGDQYLIRGNEIIHLQSELDEIKYMKISFEEFIAMSIQNTDDFLFTEPLRFYLKHNPKLNPGQLISVFPPYCIKTESERHFKAVDAIEHLHYLADLSGQIKNLKDGTYIKFET